jgi:hypothetical protein
VYWASVVVGTDVLAALEESVEEVWSVVSARELVGADVAETPPLEEARLVGSTSSSVQVVEDRAGGV